VIKSSGNCFRSDLKTFRDILCQEGFSLMGRFRHWRRRSDGNCFLSEILSRRWSHPVVGEHPGISWSMTRLPSWNCFRSGRWVSCQGPPFQEGFHEEYRSDRIFGVVRESLPVDPSVPDGGQSSKESLLRNSARITVGFEKNCFSAIPPVRQGRSPVERGSPSRIINSV
jgi:hypothetical protein